MNKTELINAMSEKSGLNKKETEKALQAFTEVVEEAMVAGEKVMIVGFGSFAVKTRAEHIGRNPQTGEQITIAASKTPDFTAGKALKDAVNK